MGITRLIAMIIFFNVVLIGLVALFYIKNRRHEKVTTDLEEFCAALPRDARLPDPCVLVNGQWVRQGPPTDTAT
jgi:hypothetical protein